MSATQTISELSGSAELNKKYVSKYGVICDMGEGFGKYTVAPDDEIMPLIDVANIACGFHAGDYNIMRRMVSLAKKHNVKVGSHPGLPDRMGFGRRKWDIPADEIYNLVMYQTGALKAFLDAEGMPLSHIKPHGELYFYVERDIGVMKAVLRAAKAFGVPVISAKNHTFETVAKDMGVDLIQEFYADLDWSTEGRLVTSQSSQPKTPDMIYERVLKAGLEDIVISNDGQDVALNFKDAPFLLCLHSDMPNSLENIKAARRAFEKLNA